MMMTLLVIIVILWGLGWCMLHPIVTGKAVCKVVGTIAMGAGFLALVGTIIYILIKDIPLS